MQRQGMHSANRSILMWELVGMAFIFVAGLLLHFVFAWTHQWLPVAWLAAVNESTWEHLKLAFWPGLVFALVEYVFIGKPYMNFWLAKWLGLLAMTGSIPVLFYGYVAVVGRHYLVVDILIFLVAVVIGQVISYVTITKMNDQYAFRGWAIAGLLVMVMAFTIFSYYPPRHFMFQDPETLQYGEIGEAGRMGRWRL